ncbi:putative steroid 17-alpha-hydroxylase/17,20 lyase [Apostichopus japonicus]|uniref:Putative steroid 17-alpha-hydroxylase/17,20 lyase n=1 Tax=Stichopus japonicus TaxID=307972 RepID=A0A2G8LBB2_STIJA|nr:putative steroid 17-alpha-hydroxylase/17,20 lyase [Apostichopus japonicus]
MAFESSAVVVNSTSLTLVTITTVLAGMWIWSQQKPTKNFPPGPKGWPLIGNILELARNEKPAFVVFTEYAKEYGDIFSIRVGQRWAVVLNGAATIKEALLKKGVEFANRPTSVTIDLFTEGGQDIVFGQYSPSWKLHRKLAFSAFRKLATGDNKRFEKLVYSIIPALTANLDSKGSEPFDTRTVLASSIYNILASLCFGKQYEFDDPELTRLMYLSKEGNEIAGSGLLADYIPIFKYVPTPGQRKVEAIFKDFFNLVNKEVDEHREKYDGGEPKDFIEMLFQSRQEIKDEGKEDMSLITEAHIRQTVVDIFGGGYTIPKDTWVLVNIYSMHYDEKLWDDPKKFTPEHFLDESGKVRLHPEGYMPFSTGRRVCIGESVAKAELFLLFAGYSSITSSANLSGRKRKIFQKEIPRLQ